MDDPNLIRFNTHGENRFVFTQNAKPLLSICSENGDVVWGESASPKEIMATERWHDLPTRIALLALWHATHSSDDYARTS